MARYKIKTVNLMVDVYEDKRGDSERTALFLPGFPATISENSLTRILNELGYCVLFPQYPGTYDSQGEFLPQNCLLVAAELQSYLRNEAPLNLKNNSKVRIPKQIELVVGYSFGAFIAAHSIASLEYCDKLIAVSPAFTYGAAAVDMGFSEEGEEFLNYIERTRPMTYRLGSRQAWMAFYNGDLNQPKLPKMDKALKNLTYVGLQDSSIDAGILKRNLPSFLGQFTTGNVTAEVVEVNDGSHSMNSVVDAGRIGQINRFLTDNSG